VGLFDEADLWHNNARAIHSLLQEHQIPIAYLDCVLNEVFTVLGRRCRGWGISHTFPTLIDQVIQAIPNTAITWLYPLLPHWYSRCLAVMRTTQGQLNLHDALIAVAMQELSFSGLMSFDTGFDRIASINRLGSSDDVDAWLKEQSTLG
jgi:predicted nucleic acid-binding protein